MIFAKVYAVTLNSNIRRCFVFSFLTFERNTQCSSKEIVYNLDQVYLVSFHEFPSYG